MTMSAVLQFPGTRTALRGRAASAAHPSRGGSVISWVRPASCECCGRPTLAGRPGLSDQTLCGHCSPPSVA